MIIKEIKIKNSNKYSIKLNSSEYELFKKGSIKLTNCIELYLPVSKQKYIEDCVKYGDTIKKIFCKENNKYILIDTIEIPEGTEELTLRGHSSIKTLVLPKSLKEIRIERALSRDLIVYYNGNIEDYCNLSYGDSTNWGSAVTFNNYSCKFYIQKDDGEIEYNGKNYSRYEELDLSNITVEKLNSSLFQNWCDSLGCYSGKMTAIKNFKLPKGLKSIEKYALDFNLNVETFEFPEGIEYIDDPFLYGFANNIILPKSLEKIEGNLESGTHRHVRRENQKDLNSYIIIQGQPDCHRLYNLFFDYAIFTDLDPLKYIDELRYGGFHSYGNREDFYLFFNEKYSQEFYKYVNSETDKNKERIEQKNIMFINMSENIYEIPKQIDNIMTYINNLRKKN